MRSLLNSMDNVDKLTEDLANLTDDANAWTSLLAQLDPTIATIPTVKDLAQTLIARSQTGHSNGRHDPQRHRHGSVQLVASNVTQFCLSTGGLPKPPTSSGV